MLFSLLLYACSTGDVTRSRRVELVGDAGGDVNDTSLWGGMVYEYNTY